MNAAIGMAAGAGLYWLSIVASSATLLVLTILRRVETAVDKRARREGIVREPSERSSSPSE
jgi:uncharacterized membrane protein YhiD involved in acid resistance